MWSSVGCDAIQPRHPSRMPPRRAPPISVLGRLREERCLRHRELDGHATPGWVLHSNSGCCIGTIKKSRTYEISSTIERFRALSVNFLKIKGRQKSQQLKKKSLASLS